jgi:hypothetical protein
MDCGKGILELSPAETVECIKQAEIWSIIGGNSHRMWSDFSTTTNGGWLQVILGFGLLMPAQLASYMLPFVFFSRLFKRRSSRYEFLLRGTESKKKTASVAYMLVAAAFALAVSRGDTFMLFTAGLMALCGFVMLCLSTSWWGQPVLVPVEKAT